MWKSGADPGFEEKMGVAMPYKSQPEYISGTAMKIVIFWWCKLTSIPLLERVRDCFNNFILVKRELTLNSN